jgi:MFS transporter, ACS family, hexuronate transporter
LATVSRTVLESQLNTDTRDHDSTFADVLRDPRFPILILVILAVNTSWHTCRVWMPLLLTNQHGYTQKQLQVFSIGYYLCADIGSWTVGLATIYFTKRGTSLHTCRVVGFGVCALLVLASWGLLATRDERVVQVLLLIVGFGALGLFPTYFSLSQELSAKHQGKVTGTLGCINALYLAGMYRVEGWIADRTLERYEYLLAAAGVPALLAFLVFAYDWKRSSADRTSTS